MNLYLPNNRSNPESFASVLHAAMARRRWTTRALGDALVPTTKKVGTWTSGGTPPDRDWCVKLAEKVGLDVDQLWARAAPARPRLHEDERSALVAQFSALDARLAVVTAQRDAAMAELSNPEAEARARALAEEHERRRLETREGMVWSILELEAGGLAASHGMLAPGPVGATPVAASRAAAVGPSRPADSPAQPVGEALLALVATARDADDGGRGLLDALVKFTSIVSLPARRSVLGAFASAVSAACFGIEHGELFGSTMADDLALPETRRLRLHTTEVRLWLDVNIRHCLFLGPETRPEHGLWEIMPLAFEQVKELYVTDVTPDEYRRVLTDRARMWKAR